MELYQNGTVTELKNPEKYSWRTVVKEPKESTSRHMAVDRWLCFATTDRASGGRIWQILETLRRDLSISIFRLNFYCLARLLERKNYKKIFSLNKSVKVPLRVS